MSVYKEAYDHVSGVRGFVTDSISDARSWANAARQSAETTLSSLSSFNPNIGSVSQPARPSLNLVWNAAMQLPQINATDFGEIHSSRPNSPVLKSVRTAPDVDIQPYLPSIASLNIPDAPSLSNISAPTEPTLGAVAIPVAPTINKPAFPSLSSIDIPDFTFPTLPTFDESAPEFSGTPVSAVLQWSETCYSTEVLGEVVNKLRDLWEGSGIPPAVEAAMWERAASREDLDVARQLSALDVEHSSRGFTQPTGVLDAQKDALREEAAVRKQGLNREIAIKMAEVHIDNVRFACEQGVAAENVIFNIWNNMAQRQFDAAKIQLDAELAQFNAHVSLFNARQQAYSTRAQVYKTKLDAELMRIEVFKAELEGSLAKGQLNEQQVRIYGEQIKALLSDVEIYKAEMQGANLQSDVNRNIIEGYKANVTAYAEKLRADKARFDAYDSRVRGELGKAQLLDAEARAYSAYVSGQSTIADIGMKQMEADIRENEQRIKAYIAELDASKADMLAQSEAIKATAQAYSADTQRFSAQASAEEARHRVDVAAKESEIRSTIGMYEVEIRRYIADVEKLISTAQLQLEAMKAAGQVSSTMAAGAMAGINIGASLSGGGSVSASGSNSRSTSSSSSMSYNSSVELDDGPKPPGWINYG